MKCRAGMLILTAAAVAAAPAAAAPTPQVSTTKTERMTKTKTCHRAKAAKKKAKRKVRRCVTTTKRITDLSQATTTVEVTPVVETRSVDVQVPGPERIVQVPVTVVPRIEPVPVDPDNDVPDILSGASRVFQNSRLADVALADLGAERGSSKGAINHWAFEASGGFVKLGGSYFSDYLRNGGVAVTRDEAAAGDVIQLSKDGAPASLVRGMHAAVVVAHDAGANTFEVVDSDSAGDGIVRRHTWDPYADAAANDLTLTIWRLGTR
jgi:hypothetical protein